MFLDKHVKDLKESVPDFYYEFSWIDKTQCELLRNNYPNNYSQNNISYLRKLYKQEREIAYIEGETGPQQHSVFREILDITRANSILEIGFDIGTSSLVWLMSGVKHLTSIDVIRCPDAERFLKEKFKDRFNFIKIDSKKIKQGETFERNFDLIFIDGGHEFENCWNDIVRSLWFKPKYILFDDVHSDGVIKAIQMSNGKFISVKRFNIDPPMELFMVNPNPITPLNSSFTI